MANLTPKLPVNEPPPTYKRLAWWIENTLVRAIKTLYNVVADPIRQLLHFSLTDWLEELEDEILDTGREAIDFFLEIPALPPRIRSVLLKMRAGAQPAALLVIVPIIAMAVLEVARSLIPIAVEPFQMTLRAAMRNTLLDPYVAITLWRRGILSETDANRILAHHGIDNAAIAALKTSATALMEEDELTQGYWRGIVGESIVNDQLRHRGYNDYSIAVWKQVRELIPSPAELLSIATREGFDDDVARQFGYDESYPAAAGEAAEKQGLSQEWFKRLWRAHWRLPGISQGFEMFQRRFLTRPQLELLLRASDIPSFWRDALIKLSYSVVTRVDVRRMYDLGVISESEVYQRNLDLGYTPEDALKLTQWIVAEYAEEDRSLTKTDILGMYKDGVLNRDEATTYLDALGYREDDIALVLARQDLLRQREYENEVVKNVHDLYLANDIDRTDVWAQLGKLNPPGAYITNLLELWDLEKRRRLVKPSITNLRDMWLTEVITDDQLAEEMITKGYIPKYIEWYKEMWLKMA